MEQDKRAQESKQERVGKDLDDNAAQIKYQNETIANMQGSLDQFRDKCFYLEQDMSQKNQENEQLRADLEKYELEYLAATGE